MRLAHGLFKLIVLAGAVAAGVLVYLYPISQLWETAIAYLPDNDLYRQIVGVAIGVVALLAMVPRLPKRRKDREISFEGSHGEVTIELEPVESTLERVVGKLAEVKSISIRLKPLDGPGRVRVLANAVLLKDAEGDARLITARVNNYIQVHTRKILGLQDVDVKLKVRKFVVNMKTVKTEPLLLEAPQPEIAPAMPQPVYAGVQTHQTVPPKPAYAPAPAPAQSVVPQPVMPSQPTPASARQGQPTASTVPAMGYAATSPMPAAPAAEFRHAYTETSSAPVPEEEIVEAVVEDEDDYEGEGAYEEEVMEDAPGPTEEASGAYVPVFGGNGEPVPAGYEEARAPEHSERG